MLDLSADSGRLFVRRLIIPLAVIAAAFLAFTFGGLLWIAEYQTRISVNHESRLARHALDVQADRLAPTAADYGYWDDAVAHIVDRRDEHWMRAQIGEGPEGSLGIDFSFVLDPAGNTIFSHIRDSRLNGVQTVALPHAFRVAYAAWRNHPSAVYATVLPYQSQAVTIAVAPVKSFSDDRRADTGYAIVFVDRIDDEALRRLEKNFDLHNLRLSNIQEEAPHTLASTEIHGNASDGQRTFLIWDPVRPGDDLLRVVMPFFGVFVVALSLLTVLMTRFISNSTKMISDREQRAGSDSLTGLANRVRFMTELDDAMNRVSRGFSGVTVMYIDLDGFKQVNDRFGHSAGDEMLQEAARRLKDCLRANDIVARIGGDEFVVLMTGWIERNYIRAIAGRILQSVGKPVLLSSGVETSVGCSIGIADCWEPGCTGADILHEADSALYAAKAAGKNTLRFADKPEIDRSLAQPVERDDIASTRVA